MGFGRLLVLTGSAIVVACVALAAMGQWWLIGIAVFVAALLVVLVKEGAWND